MKIYTTKILGKTIDGSQIVKKRIITKVNGVLVKGEVPLSYLLGSPFFVIDGSRLEYRDKGESSFPEYIYFGKDITENTFQDFLKCIKKSIKRLKKIKRDLSSWKGEETFIF